MSRFKELLTEQSFSLIVSLPANDIEFVEAAKEGGADGIKVHMNVFHHASGTSFGTLKDNDDFFERMHKVYPGVTGIVPGDDANKIIEEDIDSLKKIGFDFISVYAHAAPAWLLSVEDITKMVAISHSYSDSTTEIEGANNFPTDVLEASIMLPETYGSVLTVKDLWNYRYICQRVNQPVVVPTQKKVRVEDLPSLKSAGVKALMIGAVVTGNTPDELYRQIKAYKQAIEKLEG